MSSGSSLEEKLNDNHYYYAQPACGVRLRSCIANYGVGIGPFGLVLPCTTSQSDTLYVAVNTL